MYAIACEGLFTVLYLSNTLTGKKEIITAHDGTTITFYACGVTPYDYSHVGHGRCYILFDVFYRLLRYQGRPVRYCRNFTDIDDKLLDKAEHLYGDKMRYKEVADTYIKAYLEDMESLNCLFPDAQPRVTEVIPEIIEIIEKLIEKKHAYVVDGDVYFSVASDVDYGKLSKRSFESLQAGARVSINDKKKDPADFALWKSEEEGTFWKSPWGYGRPGWHIECSAMSKKFLGTTIDVHAGGQDLIFPHHENEIAQSESASGKLFSHNWMHVAFVRVAEEKMSKSLGNFFTLRDVFNKFDPMVIRFYILQHHYKSPLDFSLDTIASSEKAYRKLCKAFAQKVCPSEAAIFRQGLPPVITDMIAMLEDDLNTVGLLGILFDRLDSFGDDLCLVKRFIQSVLGLTLETLPEKIVCITEEMQALIDERTKARENKDWKKSDELRDQLALLGYTVSDSKI